MLIALDATALYGRFGGVENAIVSLLRELSRQDTVNRYLVFVPSDCPVPTDSWPENWEWRRLPFAGSRKLLRILWQQLELPREVKRAGCQLLHSLNYVMPLRSPVPTVVTLHDLIALDHSRYALPANRVHYRAMMPQTLKRAARVLVPAPAIAQAAARRTGDGMRRVRIVPLGLDDRFLQPVSAQEQERVRMALGLPPRFCLYLGNFEPKKNLPRLLKAHEMLTREDPGVPPLLLAGGVRPWPGQAEQLAGPRLLGFVPGDDLPALYACCEVFCFPSLAEGFGLPVLEALACGAAVLASPAVPLPGLEKVAELADPHSAKAIARGLKRLLDASEPGDGPRDDGRKYARQFTWERSGAAVLRVYRELGAS